MCHLHPEIQHFLLSKDVIFTGVGVQEDLCLMHKHSQILENPLKIKNHVDIRQARDNLHICLHDKIFKRIKIKQKVLGPIRNGTQIKTYLFLSAFITILN